MNYLYDTMSACKYLGIGKTKMRHLIKSEKISAINISEGTRKRYRIPKDALDSYITLRQLETSLGVKCGSITEMKKHIR